MRTLWAQNDASNSSALFKHHAAKAFSKNLPVSATHASVYVCYIKCGRRRAALAVPSADFCRRAKRRQHQAFTVIVNVIWGMKKRPALGVFGNAWRLLKKMTKYKKRSERERESKVNTMCVAQRIEFVLCAPRRRGQKLTTRCHAMSSVTSKH